MPFLTALYNGTYTHPLKQHNELLMVVFFHVMYTMMCHTVPICMHFPSPYVTKICFGVTCSMPFPTALYNGIYTHPLKQHNELLIVVSLHFMYTMMCHSVQSCMHFFHHM